MATDGYFTKDQVIEILDYLAKGIAADDCQCRRGPPAGEAAPAEKLMCEFIDRVRRIKGACEVDGHWPPKDEDDDATAAPPLVLVKCGDAAQAVSEAEVRRLTRTLRYMLGLSEHPACELPTLQQVEALRSRTHQLGRRWRKIGTRYGSIRAVLRMCGKLNSWDLAREDEGRVRRAWSRAVKDQAACRRQRYHRSDPYRIIRAEKYGSWNVLE